MVQITYLILTWINSFQLLTTPSGQALSLWKRMDCKSSVDCPIVQFSIQKPRRMPSSSLNTCVPSTWDIFPCPSDKEKNYEILIDTLVKNTHNRHMIKAKDFG